MSDDSVNGNTDMDNLHSKNVDVHNKHTNNVILFLHYAEYTLLWLIISDLTTFIQTLSLFLSISLYIYIKYNITELFGYSSHLGQYYKNNG